MSLNLENVIIMTKHLLKNLGFFKKSQFLFLNELKEVHLPIKSSQMNLMHNIFHRRCFHVFIQDVKKFEVDAIENAIEMEPDDDVIDKFGEVN